MEANEWKRRFSEYMQRQGMPAKFADESSCVSYDAFIGVDGYEEFSEDPEAAAACELDAMQDSL